MKDGYFFQFDDSSSKWIRARRRNSNGGATTLGTSSNGAFPSGSWFSCKIQWKQSTGSIKVWVNGQNKLSVTDTTYDDFCPSGGGIRFMSARYMSSSHYNELDWIKVYKTA